MRAAHQQYLWRTHTIVKVNFKRKHDCLASHHPLSIYDLLDREQQNDTYGTTSLLSGLPPADIHVTQIAKHEDYFVPVVLEQPKHGYLDLCV
jgi:hypothetical protein